MKKTFDETKILKWRSLQSDRLLYDRFGVRKKISSQPAKWYKLIIFLRNSVGAPQGRSSYQGSSDFDILGKSWSLFQCFSDVQVVTEGVNIQGHWASHRWGASVENQGKGKGRGKLTLLNETQSRWRISRLRAPAAKETRSCSSRTCPSVIRQSHW